MDGYNNICKEEITQIFIIFIELYKINNIFSLSLYQGSKRGLELERLPVVQQQAPLDPLPPDNLPRSLSNVRFKHTTIPPTALNLIFIPVYPV